MYVCVSVFMTEGNMLVVVVVVLVVWASYKTMLLKGVRPASVSVYLYMSIWGYVCMCVYVCM